MWVSYIKKNSLGFGVGQMSYEVSGGQILETLLIRYQKIGNIDALHTYHVDASCREKGLIDSGKGQRSRVIIGDQTLKSFLRQCLKTGRLDTFHI